MSNSPIKVIAFDVFGTLAKITEKTSPYKKLIHWLHQQGHTAHVNDAITVMSIHGDFEDIAAHFGYHIPAPLLTELNADLEFELKQIQLFDDTLSTLQQLKTQGYTIVLCSNSARPYGIHISTLIPIVDLYAWSYEVHACKPDPKIYQYVIDQIHCKPEEVLFIGDTPLADVEGPRHFGMTARLINRKKGQQLTEILADLL